MSRGTDSRRILNGLRLDRALIELHRALDEDPSAISASHLIGKVYENQGKSTDAAAALKSIVDRRPGYWTGYSGLDAFYYKHGEFAKAAVQFKAMIDLQPDNPIGYHNLGAVHMAMARYDDAIAILKQGLALKETSSAWSNLGSAYTYLDRYPEAVDALNRAAELDPHNDVLWRNLGDGYRQIPSRASDASAAYKRALKAVTDELSEDLKKFERTNALLHGDDDQIVPVGASALLLSKMVKGVTYPVDETAFAMPVSRILFQPAVAFSAVRQVTPALYVSDAKLSFVVPQYDATANAEWIKELFIFLQHGAKATGFAVLRAFSPLCAVLAIVFFTVFFAASRLHSKSLRLLRFWAPVTVILTLGIGSLALVADAWLHVPRS